MSKGYIKEQNYLEILDHVLVNLKINASSSPSLVFFWFYALYCIKLTIHWILFHFFAWTKTIFFILTLAFFLSIRSWRWFWKLILLSVLCSCILSAEMETEFRDYDWKGFLQSHKVEKIGVPKIPFPYLVLCICF